MKNNLNKISFWVSSPGSSLSIHWPWKYEMQMNLSPGDLYGRMWWWLMVSSCYLTYTPGTSLWPHPTPQLTIPASCHTPPMSHTRGLPPSPGHTENVFYCFEDKEFTFTGILALLSSGTNEARVEKKFRAQSRMKIGCHQTMHCNVDGKIWTLVYLIQPCLSHPLLANILVNDCDIHLLRY